MKSISLKELFPDWEKLTLDDISCVELSDMKRPLKFLGIEHSYLKSICLNLEIQTDGTYRFFITDALKTIAEYFFDSTLTKEIVYDSQGKSVTTDNDHENERAKEAYDYLWGQSLG